MDDFKYYTATDDIVINDNDDKTSEELKKELKSLQNKRATKIASLLSGPKQDSQLRTDEQMLKKIDTELARIRNIQNKDNAQLVSSILLNNGIMMSSSKAITHLDFMKYDKTSKV